MERDKQMLRYSSTNPLLDCVISMAAKRVVTIGKMTWYPILGVILCEFSHTENAFMYIGSNIPTWLKLVNFIKRFGHTLD